VKRLLDINSYVTVHPSRECEEDTVRASAAEHGSDCLSVGGPGGENATFGPKRRR